MALISYHDLQGLRELWHHLNSKLFRRLEPSQAGTISKLEAGVLKLYAINCVQNKNPDKLKEFFDKMSSELQGQSDWKEWFALPFLPNPETNPSFANFFARHWQDTLLLSLHNFLAIIFASLAPPKLADYHNSTSKIKRLREENDAMRQSLLKFHYNQAPGKLPPLDIPRPNDVMDDFYIIASQDHAGKEAATENQAKGLKGFLRNITGGGGGNSSQASSLIDRNQLRSSSSRSRTPSSSSQSSQLVPSASSKSHAPVKRISATSLSSLGKSYQTKTAVTEAENTSKNEHKLAYLLLGQEEYLEHHSEVTQCRFSASGFTIASSDVDGVVKIWSASPGQPQTLATFVSQSGVSALDWFPNSERKLIFGTMSGSVRICDKEERKFAHEFNVFNSENQSHASLEENHCIKQLTCHHSNLVAIATESKSEGGALMLYDLNAMKMLEKDIMSKTSLSCSVEDTITVNSCVFNHNAQMIIAGSTDGKIRIFDLRKRDVISSWSLDSPALTVQMSSDETSIYALSSEGSFSAWSFIQTSQKLFGANVEDNYFKNRDHYPRAAWGKQFAFAGDGKHLLVCSSNGGVIYEVDGNAPTMASVSSSKELEESKLSKVLGLKGHKRHATCTDWSVSNDCGPCVTAGFDGQIRISTLLSQ